MISDTDHDAEDWSNDAENSASQHRNKCHFKIYSNRNDLIWFVTFYWIFGQINA